jgi:hypothetical protein
VSVYRVPGSLPEMRAVFLVSSMSTYAQVAGVYPKLVLGGGSSASRCDAPLKLPQAGLSLGGPPNSLLYSI